ncbi:hypothetical protein PEPS_12120 [Persicobacter psychrovividus]|uniref:Uncharacterized protein n=1 Tax=Persicobacter psychrovividus TaxID=387638 RepID=A0ABN6LC94_9BACT|nr:hypothetical protein PEPS_12120 [Persicobacter psychrovividus]
MAITTFWAEKKGENLYDFSPYNLINQPLHISILLI